MDVGRLGKIAFEASRATLSQDVGRQKLRKKSATLRDVKNWGKNCNFYWSRHEMVARAARNERHETQPFRTKWTLDVKNWGKIATLRCPSQPFRTKWTLDVKNWGKIATLMRPAQPFRTKWTLDVKNWGKIATFIHRNRNPFARNGRWTSKTEEKLRWTLSFV